MADTLLHHYITLFIAFHPGFYKTFVKVVKYEHHYGTNKVLITDCCHTTAGTEIQHIGLISVSQFKYLQNPKLNYHRIRW